jgi:hypothetical protein
MIPGVGEVFFTRSARAKYIAIRIDLRKGLSVTLPVHASFRDAREFVLSHLSWARNRLARVIRLRSIAAGEAVRLVDRQEAVRTLAARIEFLAREHGFHYSRLFIRNQRTLWGSCSRTNNISLNQNLLRLPEELRDYVILHELVHTRVKDHSARFWEELCRVCPQAKTHRRRLRRYKPAGGLQIDGAGI